MVIQLHLFSGQLSIVQVTGHGRPRACSGLAAPGRPLGRDRLFASQACEYPSLWGRQAPHTRPGVHGCHLLCSPHRLPVESPRRHHLLPRLDGPRPLPGMGESWGLLRDVEGRAPGIRLPERDRLGVAEHGRVHDQGAPRGGKRQGKTPPTGPRRGPSAACWSKATACRWAWPSMGPTATT